MSTPARQDFVIRTNTNWERIWQIKSNGVAVDLTNYNFQLDVKYEKNSAARVFLSLTVGNGITIMDAVNGQFKVSISPLPLVLKPLLLPYDLLVTIAGKKYVWVEGQMTFNPGVTYS